MKEEAITLAVVKFLRAHGFEIIAFDYPGSGSGLRLSPDNRSSKNNGIIPDVIAFRGDCLIIIESKPTFVLEDVNKLQPLRNGVDYATSLQRLLHLSDTQSIYYGICFEHTDLEITKAKKYSNQIDFILTVSRDLSVRTLLTNDRLQIVL